MAFTAVELMGLSARSYGVRSRRGKGVKKRRFLEGSPLEGYREKVYLVPSNSVCAKSTISSRESVLESMPI